MLTKNFKFPKLNKKLFKQSVKFFQVLTPEEYFVNARESLGKHSVESCKLLPLPEASKNYIFYYFKKIMTQGTQNVDCTECLKIT